MSPGYPEKRNVKILSEELGYNKVMLQMKFFLFSDSQTQGGLRYDFNLILIEIFNLNDHQHIMIRFRLILK